MCRCEKVSKLHKKIDNFECISKGKKFKCWKKRTFIFENFTTFCYIEQNSRMRNTFFTKNKKVLCHAKNISIYLRKATIFIVVLLCDVIYIMRFLKNNVK